MKCKDENKLDLIYDATLKLVAKEGLSGLTMNKIAQEAGIGTGTLYVYFKGKEELINALFLKVHCRTTRFYLQGYDEKEPFKVGFKKIWMNIFHDQLNQHQCSVFTDQCYTSPYLDENTRVEIEKMDAPFFELMERGKREHLVKEMDTLMLLSAIMGIMHEFVALVKAEKLEASAENIDACFTICWDAVKQ